MGGYAAAGAWLPWSLPGGGAPPGWAVAAGLDHPFTTWTFLGAIALLFASTLACTWGKRARVAALLRGELPGTAATLPHQAGSDVAAFLRARGYRGDGPVLRRLPAALWGGWLFHVGLLVLIAAVAVQQSFHDGATLQLTEGETVRLDDPGAVSGRDRGPLAPAQPPPITVSLLSFDPFAHQPGYSPDRLSTLRLERRGGASVEGTVDRARGLRLGGVKVFQAIPVGLAVDLALPDGSVRSVHLTTVGAREAAADVRDLSGLPVRLVADAERPLDDAGGTGRVELALLAGDRRYPILPGSPFGFGGGEARVAAVRRWGAFTYSHSPGMSGVILGFALLLAGSALLALPAGVARVEPGGAARIAGRATSALVADWAAAGRDA